MMNALKTIPQKRARRRVQRWRGPAKGRRREFRLTPQDKKVTLIRMKAGRQLGRLVLHLR
jgi:hypothetical protein